jgi:hypothetical protein
MNDESDKQKTARKPGLISDLWYVIKRERKWWLIPLVIVLFGIVGLMVVAGSAGPLAPLLYPLM